MQPYTLCQTAASLTADFHTKLKITIIIISTVFVENNYLSIVFSPFDSESDGWRKVNKSPIEKANIIFIFD